MNDFDRFEIAVMRCMAVTMPGAGVWESHHRFLWEAYRVAVLPPCEQQTSACKILGDFAQWCRFDDLRDVAASMVVVLGRREVGRLAVRVGDGGSAA